MFCFSVQSGSEWYEILRLQSLILYVHYVVICMHPLYAVYFFVRNYKPVYSSISVDMVECLTSMCPGLHACIHRLLMFSEVLKKELLLSTGILLIWRQRLSKWTCSWLCLPIATMLITIRIISVWVTCNIAAR